MSGLPNKYRPEVFQDLIGQKLNVQYFTSLIKKGQVGKNIILYGQHGASKTSSARIYARGLNCIKPTEEGSPCNTCENCSAFYAETFPDYLEIDATTSGGKAKIVELKELATTPPMYGKFRIVCLDEAHSLSKAAWDTLLKLIEEPPPFLVFIFTTTEMDKVRPTIQSRCQCLKVSLLTIADSYKYLNDVCKKEGFVYEDNALKLISFISKGHPRDILKNLEQASIFGDVTVAIVKEIFSLGYVESVFNTMRCLFTNDPVGLREININWADTASFKFERLSEFMIYLNYKFIHDLEIKVNPVFESLPAADLKHLWKLFETSTEKTILNPSEAYSEMCNVFHTQTIYSDIQFELFLNFCLNFIHKQNFREEQFSKSPELALSRDNKKGNANKGRTFITKAKPKLMENQQEVTYEQPPQVNEQVELLNPEQEKPEGKVYAHTLLQNGFSTSEEKSSPSEIEVISL